MRWEVKLHAAVIRGVVPLGPPSRGHWPLCAPARAAFAQAEDLAIACELAERGILAAVDGLDRRPADVGEHQALDVVGVGGLRHGQRVQVAAHAAGESDRPVLGRCLREHQVGPGRPGREFEELRSPGDCAARRSDQIAARRVVRVDHQVKFEP